MPTAPRAGKPRRWYGSALPVRIIHMTEFLDEMIAAGRIRVKPIGESATFHDPCQIVRRGGLEAAARRVLAALGFKLVELEDHGLTGYCCGGGEAWSRTCARRRCGRRARNEAGAGESHRREKRFVTSCGQCRITLETGARNAKWDKPVESLLELVADNLAD